MEMMNLVGTEEYRLLLFQPDPESGERICIGVAVDGGLLFDPNFSRVQSFSKSIAPEILRFYLSDLRERISRSKGEFVERLVRDYAPMFGVSPPRRIVSPVSSATKLMLLRRFVHGDNEEHFRASRGAIRKQFTNRLERFANHVVDTAETRSRFISNAAAIDIFGERHKGVGRIALAIIRDNQVVLMDGLDLSLLDSIHVLPASTRVAHTFWQYGRVRSNYVNAITRVAVVFGTDTATSGRTSDAHTFAVEQLRKEADETIQAGSVTGAMQIAGLLA